MLGVSIVQRPLFLYPVSMICWLPRAVTVACSYEMASVPAMRARHSKGESTPSTTPAKPRAVMLGR
jgi:hypothetical protein